MLCFIANLYCLTESIKLKEPEVSDVFELLKKISNEWNNIGRGLGIELNDRDTIKKEGQDQKDRLERVVVKWIESKTTNVTWGTLMEVMEKLEYRDIVKEIETFLNKPNTIEKYNARL